MRSVLSGVCAVLRCLPSELEHVGQTVDSFLDVFTGAWTFAGIYERSGSLHLMQYVFLKEIIQEPRDPFYQRWLFQRATWFAAQRGDLPALKWLLQQLPDVFLRKAVNGAAAGGCTFILEWLYEHHHDRCQWGGVELCSALRNGHSETVNWLKLHCPPCTACLSKVVEVAGSAGDVEVLRWFNWEYNAKMEDALGSAQLAEKWEAARWILENFELADFQINWMGAAEAGGIEFLQFAYSLTSEGLSNDALNVDADEVVVIRDAMYAAAAGGHLEIIKWLRNAVGLELRSEAARIAAENGHLEIVKWFRDHGCEGWDVDIIDSAAVGGSVEIIKWLHENSSDQCRASTMNCAARFGHLDVVKWLHEEYELKDCSVFAMDGAARFGHLAVVQYLHANRSERCTSAAMDRAARFGHLDVVRWLHRHRREGCTTNAMDWASSTGHLETVKWLHTNRDEGCTTMAMDGATGNGHLAVVKWLHENRAEGCTPAAAVNAISQGHIEVVMFLKTHRPDAFHFGENVSVLYPCLELTQWLVTNYADEINGWTFAVPNWDLPFNAWCAEIHFEKTPGELKSEWRCNSALLHL